jgi:polyisoprenoid-binding protein YceI
MLGVTKPVTLKLTNFACGEQPFNKKPMCGGDATATIKRSEWGMTQGISTITPGDEVMLRIPFEGYKESGG